MNPLIGREMEGDEVPPAPVQRKVLVAPGGLYAAYTAPFVRVIGDASRVSTITNAVYWGYHAALDI